MRIGCFYIISVLLLGGCKTYLIAPESLRHQLMNASPHDAVVRGPFGEHYRYEAKNIRMIDCVTKDGQPRHMPNGPSIEARITLKSGRRKRMYFDRIALRNDTLIGAPSRFISSLETKIPFAEIVRIEVQNGGKRFRYDQ
jgi:hypothetical protein